MARSRINSPAREHDAEASEKPPAVSVQRIGIFAGLSQPSAREIVGRSGSRARRPVRGILILVFALALALQHGSSGNLEGQVLPGPRIVCHFCDCVREIGRLLVLVDPGLIGSESQRSRYDGYEVLQRIN